jgi:hypothetical protein
VRHRAHQLAVLDDGLPDRCVVNKGQQNLKRIILHFHILIEYFSRILVV